MSESSDSNTGRMGRLETDTSLRAERDKADEQHDKINTLRDDKADQVVQLARERADDLLELTRDRADVIAATSDSPEVTEARLAEARARADATVANERATADARLAAERLEHERALNILLRIERATTDHRLHAERDGSDRAVASRDDFMAMVSHDVRGILGAMALSAEILLGTPAASSAEQRAHVEAHRIRALTARMNRLVGDLLDVVSLESGTLHIHATSQDATSLLSETMDTFQHLAAARKVSMTSEVAKGVSLATFDHDRILQVLTNLVGNALKFTPVGGTIALSAIPSKDRIQITVRDSGCGIPADLIESMFGRFSQASYGDKRGLGLGLYIARNIVEAHGGQIWAESEPGKGSAFHFTL
jgi:signal transduction histidine kinase